MKVWNSFLKQLRQVFSSAQHISSNGKDECVPCVLTLASAHTLFKVTLIRHQKSSVELPTYQLETGDCITLKDTYETGVVIKYERRLNAHQRQTGLLVIRPEDWRDMKEKNEILRKYSQRRAD